MAKVPQPKTNTLIITITAIAPPESFASSFGITIVSISTPFSSKCFEQSIQSLCAFASSLSVVAGVS